MGGQRLLDEHFPTHGTWVGLSLGGVTVVWLTPSLSQADHRLNHVEPWADQQCHTWRRCTGRHVHPLDVSDDRLAAVLEAVSADARGSAFEGALTRQLRRVYKLEPERVRLDSTTASGYWAVTEDGLFQFGPSQDHRPDLPQVKVLLSALDPLGVPVATAVVPGQRADAPWDVPAMTRVRESLGRQGRLDVGDGKMGALATRAFIQAGGASSALKDRGRGQKRFTARTALQAAVEAIRRRPRVQGLLAVRDTEGVQERPLRRYGHRPATVRGGRDLRVTAVVDRRAVAGAVRRLGWRVYATHAPADQFSLGQAGLAYRRESLMERDLGRWKGPPLSLTPRSLERDDHATGLIRLLLVGWRVLTRLAFVGRRRLAAARTGLAGLYAGNPTRATARPTAERLLEAFRGLAPAHSRAPGLSPGHLYEALSRFSQTALNMSEP